MNTQEPSRHPSPDPAERDAFFPSPYSLSQFTSAKSDLSGADYPDARRDGRWKVLMIAADERYLPTANGHLFSTGNHPVETLLPMYHLDKAGFDIDVATLSGNAAKFEWWAFPREDKEIGGLYDRYEARFRQPLPLAEVVAGLDAASDYAALFIPGGHGALIGLPQSRAVKAALHWAMAEQRHIITLCHGPAACWPQASTRPTVVRCSAATASVPSPMRWTGRRRRSATCPGSCRGSSVNAWRSRACRSSMTASMAACCRTACC